MARMCQITGKKAMTGNNVSHANNKSKRRFLPNLQSAKFYSISLKKYFNMKITVRAMKTVEKNGGIDTYLLKTKNRNLAAEALKIKRDIIKNQKNDS